VVEVELLQRLDGREVRGVDAHGGAGGLAVGDLAFQTAVRYSSCDQFRSRAWAAKSSQTRPIVGVFNARVR
jgi:hypothetical protein